MTTMITMRNLFHLTISRGRLAADGSLSERQVRRIERELCGMRDCTCGGIAQSEVDGGGEIVRTAAGAIYFTPAELL